MAILTDFDDELDGVNDRNVHSKSNKNQDQVYEGDNHDDIYTGSVNDEFNDDPLFGGISGERQLGDIVFGDDEVSGDGFKNHFAADASDEVLVYNVTNNQGTEQFYDGDASAEKLVLQVTEEQWQQSWLQTAICDFEQFINQARPGDIFDFSIYDHAGRYLQFKAANFQAVLIELLTGGSRSSSEEDSISDDGDVTAQ